MSIDSTVQICLDRFFPSFLKLKELGYNPCAWAIPPANNIRPNSDPSNPVFGGWEIRADTIYYWNRYLKERCVEHGMDFYSIWDQTVAPTHGYIDPKYMFDYCHISFDETYPLIRVELTK